MQRYSQPIDMNGNQILNLRAENVATLPAAGSAGRLVWLSTDDMLYRDTGAAWVTEVERGSNANGTFYKYPDGRLECFHTLAMGSVIFGGAGTFADPYYTDAQTWTYPHVFIASPSVHLTPEPAIGVAFLERFLAANYSERSASQVVAISAYRTTSVSTDSNVTVQLSAFGRWKV